MKNIIIIILLLSFFTFVNGEVTYIKIDDSSVEYGEYNDLIQKTKIQKIGIEDKEELVTKFHKNNELKVLYYIHSLYGDFRPYHKNSINRLKQINDFDKIVCIEWNAAKIRYTKTWKHAGKQGEQIGELMNLLLSKNKNSILCHSMGNRIFEGISTKLTEQAKIEKIILVAADLGVNSFQNGESFNKFKPNEIVVLVNKKDKLLRLSKFMHQKKRLGLNGTEGIVFSKFHKKEKIDIWDITNEVREGKFGSGHVYFKRTDTVFHMIKNKLEN